MVELTERCNRNYLELNVTKSKELIIDFGREKISMDPIVIRGQPVEMVENYKYLGTIIDSKLDWTFRQAARKQTNTCTFSES